MIIDDSESSRSLLEHLLRKAEYDEILAFSSFHQALPYINDTIDLILLDIIMPEIDGIKGCEIVRNQLKLKDIPIIMVTGEKEIETLKAAFEAGASDYIEKPFHKIELLARMSSSLRLKQEIKARKARESDLLDLTKQLTELTEELQEKNKILENLSTIDGLTGIANRRKLDDTLLMYWKKAQRTKQHFSIIMLDIDNFKAYNDHYGHQKGDEVLRLIAHVINLVPKRADDLFARYGGEEFVVLLPDTAENGAYQMAQRIQKEIIELAVPHHFSLVKSVITVSMGIATFSDCCDLQAEELLRQADHALYDAKRTGGNRIKVFGGRNV
ncbi:hypothetical protein BHU72_02040 [Desulfuribacillus stibiiarsenatis]|uniref:Diguanylate cyclase response regulator n=1 Tax=Desulfuribacillus stibiiarsenatis TaxID=1390249 RepID=A0A1E5L7A6_9FIRM|nr:diguanylate cyclase [Desulfuribacillus stibiiarsenatis]OEH85938.1 hypothetical protein BHU72_02040 [Desulfuribacillus stibiiarsenatis]